MFTPNLKEHFKDRIYFDIKNIDMYVKVRRFQNMT